MTILRTNKPDLPTGADYLHAALCFVVLAALGGALWLLLDAWGYRVSVEHENIVNAGRMMVERVGR